MSDDPRCCGIGTCSIDTEGRCWCGQQRDGQTMGHLPPARTEGPGRAEGPKQLRQPIGSDS